MSTDETVDGRFIRMKTLKITKPRNEKTITSEENEVLFVEISTNIKKLNVNAKKNSSITILDINNKDAKRTLTTEKGAEITLVTCDTKSTDSENHAILKGDNSKIITINLYKAENSKININSTSEHIGKNTYSLIYAKGVLTKAESHLRGLVKIGKKAESSNGYQKSDIIILENSKATSIPDLEIYNNDVKCSHGSTITRIDPEKIFYLQSRGLNKKQAELTIINGFYEPAMKDIKNEHIKYLVREVLEIQ